MSAASSSASAAGAGPASFYDFSGGAATHAYSSSSGAGGLGALGRTLACVFDTSFQGKSELLNALQYAVLAVPPVLGLNHLCNYLLPEATVYATAYMLCVELLFQLLLLVAGFVLIHRLITCVPTLSGVQYERVNLTAAILPFLVLVFSLQTKMGLKAQLLLQRLGLLSARAPPGGRPAPTPEPSMFARPSAPAPPAPGAPPAPRPGGALLR